MPARRPYFRRGPDVLDMLRGQAAVVAGAVDAFERWAGGDESAGDEVTERVGEGALCHRDLVDVLIDVLSTPVEREDLYLLSERLQEVAVSAREVVREADALRFHPDAHTLALARLVHTGVGGLVSAVDAVHRDREAALRAVETTFRATDELGDAYGRAMASMWDGADPHTAAARHATYRRCADLSQAVDRVAHRVRYGVLKDV